MKSLKIKEIAQLMLQHDISVSKVSAVIKDLVMPQKLLLPYKTNVKGEDRFAFQYAWHVNDGTRLEDLLEDDNIDNLDIIRLRYLYYIILDNDKVGDAVFEIHYLLKTFGWLGKKGFKHIIFVKSLNRSTFSCTGEFDQLWESVGKQYGPAWIYEKPDVQVISNISARECIEDILRGIGSERVLVATEDVAYLTNDMATVGIENERPVNLMEYLRRLGIPILEITGSELPMEFENEELLVWDEYIRPEK